MKFASDFGGEVEVNLGPIGNAYLGAQYAPLA